MGSEDEDITIDLELHDYLTGRAAAAAHEMRNLGQETRKTARALLLLDKRADKAANSLYRLAAACAAARGEMGRYNAELGITNNQLSQTTKKNDQMNKSLTNSTKNTKSATKNFRLLHKALDRLKSTAMLLAKALALVSVALAGVAAAAAVVAGSQQILAVAGALWQLVAFGALIPVAFAAIIGIAATAMVTFKGLGEQIQKFIGKDTIDTFKKLQKAVQETFIKSLDKDIPRTLRKLAPTIRSGMQSVTREIAVAANKLVEFFGSKQGVRLIQDFFRSAQVLLKDLNRSLKPLMTGFGDIIDAAMPAWKRVSGAIGNGLTMFGKWMSNISKNGQLEEWLNNAFVVAGQLAKMFGSIMGILSGIVKASGDGMGVLGLWNTVLEKVSTWVNSLEGNVAISNFFAAMGDTLTALMPVVLTVAGIIANTLLPTLNAIVTNIAPYLNTFFQALGSALDTLAPYLPPLATAFGQLLVALTPLLPILAQVVGWFATHLATVLPMIIPLISAVANIFQNVLGPAFEFFAGLLQAWGPLIQTFFTVFMTVLSSIAPLLQQVGEYFQTALNDKLAEITAYLPTLIPLIVQFATLLATVLVQALQMILPLLPQLIDIWMQASSALLPLVPLVMQLVIAFLQVFVAAQPVISVFFQLISVILTLVAGWVTAVSSIISAAASFTSGVANAVSTVIGWLGKLISKAGQLAGPFISAAGSISGAISGISGAISGVIGSISNLISKASALASIDVNPFRFAGGPVEAGQKYTVNEIGAEMFVPNVGKPQMIEGGIQSRSFGSDGFIVPSFMLGAFKSMEAAMEQMESSAPESSMARELALVAAAMKPTETNHYSVKVDIHGNAEPADVERAVKKALRDIEQDKKERG